MNSDPYFPREEETALERLARESDRSLRNFARSRVQDPALADDLTQDAWVRVIKRFDRAAPLTAAYAYQALRWAIGDHFRKVAKERKLANEVGKLQDDNVVEGPGVSVDTEAHIDWLVSEIHPRHVEILYLSEVAGMNSTEIGTMLGMRPSTVRGYLRSVRRKLADYRSTLSTGELDEG